MDADIASSEGIDWLNMSSEMAIEASSDTTLPGRELPQYSIPPCTWKDFSQAIYTPTRDLTTYLQALDGAVHPYDVPSQTSNLMGMELCFPQHTDLLSMPIVQTSFQALPNATHPTSTLPYKSTNAEFTFSSSYPQSTDSNNTPLLYQGTDMFNQGSLVTTPADNFLYSFNSDNLTGIPSNVNLAHNMAPCSDLPLSQHIVSHQHALPFCQKFTTAQDFCQPLSFPTQNLTSPQCLIGESVTAHTFTPESFTSQSCAVPQDFQHQWLGPLDTQINPWPASAMIKEQHELLTPTGPYATDAGSLSYHPQRGHVFSSHSLG